MISISAVRGSLMAIHRPAYQSSVKPPFSRTSSGMLSSVSLKTFPFLCFECMNLAELVHVAIL